MVMLHTVNKSPFERNTLDTCLRLAEKGSSILLIEDGITAAVKSSMATDKIASMMDDFTFYALEPDVLARGFNASDILQGIILVDYNGFVKLVSLHGNIQAWL